MKYKDLLSQDTVIKLSSYAFARDNVDTSVFKLYSETKPIYDFINNQKTKLLERIAKREQNGSYKFESDESRDAFRREMMELLQKESEFDIPRIDITEEDFASDNCCRPRDKELWLNAIERDSILRFASLTSEVIDS